MAGPVGVVLCEDVPELRELTRYGLEQDGRLRVVGEAGSAEECLDKVREARPHAILLDLSLPGMDGLDAIARLREIQPSLRIVVLSGLDAARMEPLALARGADAYVEKGTPLAEIRETLLQGAAEGESRAREGLTDLDRFARVASHDLSEPLRVTGGFIELLQERYADSLDDDGRRFIANALGGVRRMEALLADLLAYSRLGHDEPVLVEVGAGAAVAAAIEACEQQRASAGAEISVGSLPTVRADRRLLAQLFEHLISNAIKFAGEGARIEIAAEPADGAWRFSVADDGPGIAPDKVERAFELFGRLHGRDVPGTGVGLALCSRIVDLHGGELDYEPAPGGGSVFAFTIPEAIESSGPDTD